MTDSNQATKEMNDFYQTIIYRLLCWLGVAVLLTTRAAAQCTTPNFDNVTSFTAGAGSRGIATGDFNRDGKLDLAVANNEANNVSILLGNGSGSFSSPTNIRVGQGPIAIVTADFNKDNNLDLAVGNFTSGTVSILLGNGSGGFSGPTNFAVDIWPIAAATGDFNGDNNLDLAVANQYSNNVSILLGNGSGGFSGPTNFAANNAPTSVATGDFNKDSQLDLVVANYNSNDVSILLGDGSGGFSSPTNIAMGLYTRWVITADFDNDGNLDIAVANSGSDNVYVCYGNGMGGFSAPNVLITGSSPFSLAASDFNSDGRLDLAVANFYSGNISILLGGGGRSFTGPHNFTAGVENFALLAGDFNSDTHPDVAIANTGGVATVLLNRCQPNNTPTINATNVMRTAGAPTSSANIAAVNDLEQVEDTLSVTATLASGSGVTIQDISVAANGIVTANVTATCTATTSTFTLRVTDSGDLFAEATLTVTVNANQLPVLSYSNIVNTTYGTGITVNPGTGPRDDIGVNSLTVQSITPTDPGGITVNGGGVVTVANNVPAGTYTVTIRASAVCGNRDASFTLNISKITPTVTWNNPADITYAEALSSTQLNATANVPGGFSYTPSATTVLNAGSGQTLSVTFTPTDSNNYATVTKSVRINVLKGTPMISWEDPGGIFYGTALDHLQLNAVVFVAGSLVYTPAAGTVLNAGTGQTLSVTFTPADAANYNTASKTVTIDVLKATPSLTWAKPADIVFGTALSATQLNAMANVPGTFNYNPGVGAMLNVGNNQTLSVLFTPSDIANFDTASKNVSINVLKITPTLTWANPADIVFGTPLSETQLNATANVPGMFNYSPGAGVVLSAGNGQTLSVTFTPTDSANYMTVSKAVQLNVVKALPLITWANPADIVFGTPLSATQLNATANVPGMFNYSPGAGAVLSAGNGQTLSVTFTPTDSANYMTVSKAVQLNVVKALPLITWANPADIVFGTPLGATQLNATANVPGSFVYSPASGTVLGAGNGQTLMVTVTPTDAANYVPATKTVQLNVLRAAAVVTWANPADIVYGTALSAAQLNATANVPGTFVYNPGGGTVLNAGNNQPLTLTFTPTDTTNYSPVNQQVLINVRQATPLLAWASPAYLVPGPLTSAVLNATASLPGSFSYTPALGTLLTTGTQTLTVEFTPQDTANYQPVSLQLQLPVAPRCFNPANGTLQIAVQGGSAPWQYSINGGAAFGAANLFQNLPAGTYAVVVKDARGQVTAPQPVTLTQPAALSVSPASLPTGIAGQPFSQVLTVSGGTGAQSVILDGTLPNWLSFVPASGLLSGTAPTPTTVNFALIVTDQAGCTARFNYTLTITCPSLTFSPSTLVPGVQGTPYNQRLTVNAVGGNYSFAVTGGQLPQGLTLNSDGSFSGAPTQSGSFSFRVTATGFGTCNIAQSYLLQVNCPDFSLSPANLPDGTVGTAYQQSFSVNAPGSYQYSITSGTLPTGLSLHPVTGALTGTPTVSGGFSFTVTVTAGSCAASRSYTITIGCTGLSFSPASLPNAQAGVAYSQSFTLSPAGAATFSLVVGNLPPGLSLTSAGSLTGLATATGTYNFSIKAERSTCSTTKAYTLIVTCPTVTVNPTSLPSGSLGTVYNQTLTATPGGNYSFALSSGRLPAGLSLSTAGVLSGTPTASGTFTFTVRATAFGSCEGTRNFTLTIAAACATTTLPSLANGVRGANYYGDLATTTPSGSYTFSLIGGTLPPGLALDNLFGALTGTPTTAGTYNFTLQATNANGCTGTRSYSFVVSNGAAARAALADYDGDGVSDLVRGAATSDGWQIRLSQTQITRQTSWGGPGDVPLRGDYDGDGQTDLAVFRPANGTWYIKQSSDGAIQIPVWGGDTDVPVPGDYDGDGKTDLAVWRPAEGNWYVRLSRTGGYTVTAWGLGSAPYLDTPVPGDYDGDGQTDLAVFRRTTGTWLIRRSRDGQFTTQAWGQATDVPVAADYDGDGRTDVAVWRGKTGEWFVLQSADQRYQVTTWGATAAGDVPVVGDYDGDGLADLAVWRAPLQRWYILPSASVTPLVIAQTSIEAQPLSSPAPVELR